MANLDPPASTLSFPFGSQTLFVIFVASFLTLLLLLGLQFTVNPISLSTPEMINVQILSPYTI